MITKNQWDALINNVINRNIVMQPVNSIESNNIEVINYLYDKILIILKKSLNVFQLSFKFLIYCILPVTSSNAFF